MLTEKQLRDALDLVSGLSMSIQSALPRADQRQLQRLQALSSQAGVVGLGLGVRVTLGSAQSQLVMKYYVARKVPASKLAQHLLIPKTLDVPTMKEPVETDIEEIGAISLEAFTQRVRPVLPAYSVGNELGGPGSIGCLVKRAGSFSKYFLSNRHVFVWEPDPSKATVIQPARDDGGTAPDVIGKVVQWSNLVPDSGFTNLCDCALLEVDGGTASSAQIPQIGQPKGVNRTLARGMKVQKTGAVTGYTTGEVKDIDFRTTLTYPSIGRVGFRDQVLCSRYSSPGDSGSCILDMNNEVVGLHFAGSLAASIFTPILFVLDELEIEVVT